MNGAKKKIEKFRKYIFWYFFGKLLKFKIDHNSIFRDARALKMVAFNSEYYIHI